jgi:hypothetical protein
MSFFTHKGSTDYECFAALLSLKFEAFLSTSVKTFHEEKNWKNAELTLECISKYFRLLTQIYHHPKQMPVIDNGEEKAVDVQNIAFELIEHLVYDFHMILIAQSLLKLSTKVSMQYIRTVVDMNYSLIKLMQLYDDKRMSALSDDLENKDDVEKEKEIFNEKFMNVRRQFPLINLGIRQ